MSAIDLYARAAPSAQQTIDLFRGEWTSRLPDELGVEAGTAELYADPRLPWFKEVGGGFKDANLLELGPLEGGHTWNLLRAGAREVTAIEGNSRAFLRCLVMQNLLAMRGATFLFGDFTPFMLETDERFDAVVALGVLYHMANPASFIAGVTRVAPKVLAWTHYYDDAVVAANPGLAARIDREPTTCAHEELTVVGHRYHYLTDVQRPDFLGGPADAALWLPKHEIARALDAVGFEITAEGFHAPDYHAGPAYAFVAERR